ncbi:MAG: PilZ domain-containing protein [Mariprofundaceae bacterium]|nr:PilZ domain-containing protein [Mariprofundaceae bacterium]
MLKHVKKETRSYTRVRFSTRAEVEVNGASLYGDVIDMSMSGIYMRSAASVQVGDACEVRIMLGDDDPMVMHALGHVARCDAQGFAISFSGFYCDSDSCLKQVILHSAGNREVVEKEIESGPRLSIINP